MAMDPDSARIPAKQLPVTVASVREMSPFSQVIPYGRMPAANPSRRSVVPVTLTGPSTDLTHSAPLPSREKTSEPLPEKAMPP